MSAKLNCLALMIVVAVSTAVQAAEPFITFVPTGAATANTIPGQSMRTPAGGPWNRLSFHWLSEAVPSAFGDVFLLDQEYLGEPGDLSRTSPGFIASAAADTSGQEYRFEDSLTLQPSTQYHVYANSDPRGLLNLSASDEYGDGMAYQASSRFTPMSDSDWGFGFSGVAVPEPSTFALAAIGLLGLAFHGWRRKR